MQISVTSVEPKQENDFTGKLLIVIDGRIVFNFRDTEDTHYNTLSSGFADCYEIVNALKAAYTAGCNKEPITIEYKADE